MKRQTLQIGSALLATTALSSVANAVSLTPFNTTSAQPATSLTAASLSAQVFGATTPEGVVLGPLNVNVDFTASLGLAFDVELTSTNSDFTNGGSTALEGVFAESAGGTFTAISSFSGCTVTVLQERILITDCLAVSAGVGNIDAIAVSGISFDEANGLATAGTSIALAGTVARSSNGEVLETIASTNVVTSADSIADVVNTGTAGNILDTAVPAFSNLTGGAVALTLGSVVTSNAGTVGTDLTTAVDAAGASFTSLTSALEIVVTHGVLTDAATSALSYTDPSAAVTSVVPSNFNGNVSSFNFTPGTTPIGSFDIAVHFDGTTAISGWAAGTVDVTYSRGENVNLAGNPSLSGALASLSRGGFGVEINSAQSSAGSGADKFQSFVRIVNNGAVAGAATIVVLNDADGSVLGTYVTESIPAGATLQVGMPEIETGAGITPAGKYGLSLSGPITGYAQHVVYNSLTDGFTNLSGFRIGSGTNNP